METATTDKALLTEREAARFLACSRALLRKLRGQPSLPQPPYVRLSRAAIRYPQAGLESFLAERMQPRKAA